MATEQLRLIGEDCSVYRGEFSTTALTVSNPIAKDTLVKIAQKDNGLIDTLSADLITANVLTTTVTLNGVTLTPVASTYATDHDTTIAAHIGLLAAVTGLACVASGARGFQVNGDVATDTVSMVSVVTLGASQATVVQTYASKFGELIVGDYFTHNKATPITIATNDTYYPMATGKYNKMMDLSSVTIDISQSKIDTTALADAFMTARNGKKDLTGTVEFVFIKGITDDPDSGTMNSFFRIAKITSAGIATVTPVRTSPYLIVAWLDSVDATSGNDKEFIVLTVEFESFTLGGSMGSVQTTSAPFHITGGFTPTIYKIANA